MSRTAHGPIERLSFQPGSPPLGAQVSVYRVGDTLVDTASTRVTAEVLRALADRPPRRIVLTHQHEDHIGNVRAILDAFGRVPVHAPRALVDAIVAMRRVAPYRAAFWGDPRPVERDDLVPYDPGDVFEAAGVALVAEDTPGHTPGHAALVADLGDDVLALTGDLYASKPLDAFFESAADDTIASYRKLARIGSRLRMLPTHGRVRHDGADVLSRAADALACEAEAIERLAGSLGTRDPIAVAEARWGEDPLRVISSGEMGRAIFVRSVLSPARALPVAPLVG